MSVLNIFIITVVDKKQTPI